MHGKLESGKGVANILISDLNEILFSHLSFRPFPGTLNLSQMSAAISLTSTIVHNIENALDNCDGIELHSCSISGIKSALIRPLTDNYPKSKFEIIAPTSLRKLFSLSDGDLVHISAEDNLWNYELKASLNHLDNFDGVIFDLDGTLTDLDVNWKSVRTQIRDLFPSSIDPFSFRTDRNNHAPIYELALQHGLYEDLLDLLASHELDGTKNAIPLPLLDVIPDLDCPVGLCTKNSYIASQEIAEKFNVHFDSFITRESTFEDKPNPLPLQKCIEDLEISPGNTLFIGNEKTDAETAYGAGTNFLQVDQFY